MIENPRLVTLPFRHKGGACPVLAQVDLDPIFMPDDYSGRVKRRVGRLNQFTQTARPVLRQITTT
jgi:hypothetical protein